MNITYKSILRDFNSKMQRPHWSKQLEEILREARLKLPKTQNHKFRDLLSKLKEENDQTLLENALSFERSLKNDTLLHN